MTEFTEIYKKLSNTELLQIISESHNYKPEAVETAKDEIASRDLTQQELENAKNEVELRIRTKQLKAQNLSKKKQLYIDGLKPFLESINPIQKGSQSSEKIFRLTIVITLLIIATLIYDLSGFIRYLFSSSLSDLDLSGVLYIAPLIIAVIGLFLYWKRKRVGWILLTFLFSYSFFGTISMLFYDLFTYSNDDFNIDYSLFETSKLIAIVSALFYGGLLYINCKRELRESFEVTNRLMLTLLATSIVVVMILLFPLLSI